MDLNKLIGDKKAECRLEITAMCSGQLKFDFFQLDEPSPFYTDTVGDFSLQVMLDSAQCQLDAISYGVVKMILLEGLPELLKLRH